MNAGWRRVVVGSPVALTVAAVAACSVGLSVAALFGLTAALRLSRTPDFPLYIAMSVVIPLLVSVPVSWVIVRLLREVEAARRQAERLAWYDDLTGLSNRRRLCELAQRELDMAQRTGEPLVAALLDLDDFKRVNDRHGHAAGDLAAARDRTAHPGGAAQHRPGRALGRRGIRGGAAAHPPRRRREGRRADPGGASRAEARRVRGSLRLHGFDRRGHVGGRRPSASSD